MRGLYNWSSPFSLPHPGSGVLLFTTDASSDVHVAISPLPESMNPMYEFVIGGWGNTTSVVRRGSQGDNLCKVPVGMNKPEVEADNEFWISIDKRTKLLRMGYGREPGFESMFLEEARYACFSTWEVPATYKDVVVLAME